ncbi:UDP-glucose 4-epimerase isoform X1 [Gallus gallus]|uniref:UDP-glucose 4-epimerase isoform X1 n=1 Tax=Gallus gallus TaxID=9031 RepID=UPI001AE1D19D|nr:UDP-glucose 4-epimerase isoform X1 [Gallus gallus]XP_040545864.1 UDP-glucose 4-epimerase isoform X1 [Gallus gallus]
MAERILVTGGAGYIGSHCVLQLAEAGYEPVVIDNLRNAARGPGALPESLQRVQRIAQTPIAFQELDITDGAALRKLFSTHRFSAVMHFAGLKAVGESVRRPLEYYNVNLTGTIRLLEAMEAYSVRNIVFSSSATVYGDPQYLPLDEKHPVGGCTNPYGKSKYFIEEMIQDLCKAEKGWNAILLRYFNPIGAHESGMIGEDPQGIPNNLMPYVAQVAVGRQEFLSVFGNDYETADGTGIRDYIHVVDLAKGHIAALKKLKENCGCKIYNLGTGTGYSVLQMVQAMEKASGRELCSPCRSSTRSQAGGREMWLPAMLTQNLLSVSWAGKLHLVWTRCVRTCGAGSCRIPQDTARTEPRPKGSFYGTGFRGLPPPLPPCFLILTPPGFLHLTELSQGPASLPRALNPLTERSGTWNRRVLGGDAYCRRGCIQCSDMVLGA